MATTTKQVSGGTSFSGVAQAAEPAGTPIDGVGFYAASFPDKSIDFEIDKHVWNVGADGKAFRWDGNDWAEVKNPPAKVLKTYKMLASKVEQQKSAKAEPAAPKTSAPIDTVDKKMDDPTLIALKQQVTTLSTTVTQQQRDLEELRARASVEADKTKAAEAKQTEEARKPSFWRGLLEIFEFMGRWFMPLINLVSAVVRLARMVWHMNDKNFDWKQEGMRLLGDVAGIFFPPAGAIANSGFNLWFDAKGSEKAPGMRGGSSQMLGGINELYDNGNEVRNPIREGAAVVAETGGKVIDAAKDLYHGGAVSVKQGSKEDDGVKPLDVVTPAEVGV